MTQYSYWRHDAKTEPCFIFLDYCPSIVAPGNLADVKFGKLRNTFDIDRRAAEVPVYKSC
jgi:hypothetical protein